MFHVIANMNLIISHMLHYYRVLLVLSWRKTKNNSRTGRERERERERDGIDSGLHKHNALTSVSTRSLAEAASAARTGR
jgi:hypothetical protein